MAEEYGAEVSGIEVKMETKLLKLLRLWVTESAE